MLAAPFRSLPADPAGQVFYDDSRIDFIAVLAARSAPPCSGKFALLSQIIDRPAGWMVTWFLRIAHIAHGCIFLDIRTATTLQPFVTLAP